MDTQALIKELRDIYISKYPQCEDKIGQGSSLAQIESAITKIRPIPKALIDIYSCVGGENSDLGYCYDFLVPGYYLVPLNEIDSGIDRYKEHRLWEWAKYFKDLNEAEFHKVTKWKSYLVSFLEDGGGGSVVLRTLPNDKSIWKIPKVSDSKKLSTNIDRFLLITIECYRQGVYEEDEDGDEAIEIDWDLAKEIASKIDPEVEDYSHP
jgi:hypothetical protein